MDTDLLLDDSDLDAIIAAPKGPLREMPGLEFGFTESCPKCRGTGSFRSYSGRVLGDCFACKGKGKMTFKSSPQARATNRTKAADRKVRDAAANIDAFAMRYPEVWSWMNGNTFEFAVAMRAAVEQYGSLTERQLAACVSCIQKRDAAKAAAVARVQDAKAIDTSKIEAAFAKASSTLRAPRLRVAGFTISHAGVNSRNAGALYVKTGESYLGKIIGGKFVRSRECDDAAEGKLMEVASDPLGAAIAYGRVTGECACCGRRLTNKESIERGIGPICAETFFG